jgi:dTDP-4-dehydrorhamnose 3,5-epimerase
VYKCSDFYTPDDEFGILWSDPAIGIEWPVKEPILSSKDSQYPTLSDTAENVLPVFTG